MEYLFFRKFHMKHCYRPQRSCGQGNIFTPVCHSVHRGVVSQHALQVVSQHALQQGVVSQHALQVSRPKPRGGSLGVWPEGVSRPPPRGGLQAHNQGVSQHALRQTSPNSYCCGWYTSYWNAFLYVHIYVGCYWTSR